jgi:Bacterial Ig domain
MAMWRVSLGEYMRLQDVSADGRHILHGSYALTDAGASSGQGLLSYDFDTVTGVRQPILVNLVAPLTESGPTSPTADEDASVIAFDERSGSLVPDDTNRTYDVFVLDRATGGLTRVSEAEDGAEPDAGSGGSLLTADGREVFFVSAATNLVPGDVNGLTDVFARDLGTGALSNLTPTRGDDTTGFDFALNAVSADGSRLLLLGADQAGGNGTFLLDRRDGGRLTRVAEHGHPLSGLSSLLDLSGDGRLALLPGDHGGLVLRDLDDASAATVLADFPSWASLSSDGRFAAFASTENGLVPGDANGTSDLFVFDRDGGEIWRVSLDENGEPLSGRSANSFGGSFSGGEVETAPAGGFPIVAFNTDLPLLDGDTEGTTEVYAIEVDAIAVADRAATAPGRPVRIDVLANDIDLDGAAPSIAGLGPVAGGAAVVEDGVIVFTPGKNSPESISFNYTIHDGEGNQDQAVVRVHVVSEGPLVATTAEDVVANDGLLSLREAVEAANARAGADTIGFDDSLRGATLLLEQGALEGVDANVTLLRATVTGLSGYALSEAIRMRGGSLLMQSSEISNIGSEYVAKGITSDETEVRVIDSRILGMYGFEVADAIGSCRGAGGNSAA